MIWATVDSQSCFCWLYRASPSLAAKNIINLILVSTIWWYPCVESSLVLLEEGICYDQCILLAKLLGFALLHFVLQGQICLLLQVSVDFLLLHSSSLWWKGCLFIILHCTCTGLGDRKYVLPICSVTSRQVILFGWHFPGTALHTDSRWWFLQAA